MSSYNPALLISYAYVKVDDFEKTCHTWKYRDLIIDSGAWTAHTTGKTIVLGNYIDACKRIAAADPARINGFFSLDVIGDWKGSLANTKKMWAAGVESIPVFHYGEPWDVLRGLAADYPKIGIGGIARDAKSLKLRFAQQCFQHVWPKRIHGLGFGSKDFTDALPFHSCDASTWNYRASAFGEWKSFGNAKLSVRTSRKNGLTLKNEVVCWLNQEAEARGRWAKIMPKIGVNDGSAPTVYLAAAFTPEQKRLLAI